MLLNRPYPKPNEHMLSYLLRVSWENHFRCLNDLLNILQMRNKNSRVAYKKITIGNFNLSPLTDWLGMQSSIFKTTIAQFTKGKGYLCNMTVPLSLLDFSRPRFCPICLVKAGYIDAYNSISAISYCPVHKIPFFSHWQDGSAITWNSKHFLDKALQEAEQPLPCLGEGQILSEVILSLIQRPKIIECCQALGPITLNDFLFLLHFMYRFSPSIREGKCSQTSTQSKWNIAFSYIDNWPMSLFELFRHYEVNHIGSVNRSGIRATYRDMYDDIYTGSFADTNAYAHIRRAFEQFITRAKTETPLWSSNHKLIPKESICLISSKATGSILSVRKQGLDRYIELRLLTPYNVTESGIRLFKKIDVYNLCNQQKYFLTFEQLKAKLQISRPVIKTLLDHKLLVPIARATDFERDWIFDSRDVQKLINQLISNASSQDDNASDTQATKYYNFLGYESGTIYWNMMMGSQPYYFAPDLHNKLSLKQFIPIIISTSAKLKSDVLAPQDVAKLLQVNINAIYDMCNRQFLETHMFKPPNRSRAIKVITKKSIAKFLATHQLKPKSKKHLTLVNGPKINGGVVNIYRSDCFTRGGEQ